MHEAPTIDFRSRALPLITIHFGRPTDPDIPVHGNGAWVVECLSPASSMGPPVRQSRDHPGIHQ